ncbi:hybrid sensor histidine kinase/response regulator [Phormidium sp. CCY1219]|nr:hybrid sensor histidine kinase/response regulator [Phormidium sp. CCY1219]MEB3827075.1 hybrid sensor histidine kinase/response regulator [Phormidium sp. CCY1219]
MMIEDEELRMTFKVASEEHLQKLEEGLLHLENQPDDSAKIEELMREAHSLKGDAGMLGVKDIATLAHQWEHLLGTVKRGESPLTSDLCDRLYYGLDAIGKLVEECITGEAAGVNTFYVLARLMGAKSDSADRENSAAESSPTDTEQVDTEDAHTQDAHTEDSAPEEPPREDSDLQSEAQEGDATSETTSVSESVPPTEEPNASAPESNGGDRPSAKPPAPPAEPTEPPHHHNGSGVQRESPPPRTTKPLPQAQKKPPAPSPTSPHQASPAPVSTAPSSNYRIDTIRVETRNLDGLMTQTGELTVTKIRIAHRLWEVEEIVSLWEEWSRDAFINRFALEEVTQGNRNGALQQLQGFHHRLEERLDRLGKVVNRLRNAVYEDNARLDIISDELEEGIRTLRLLPLSTIFNLFPRMVRDLAKQEGKQVELIVQGAQTRADKRILEEMKDPLMHIIRNAIDHGIETPEQREAQGKPAKATIRLEGYQTATNIIIEVSDDGRGLDLEKIKKTAIARGICREEELAAMTPTQIQSLIFAPGFSTRTFVTEVSGRGVGLDVVRTNVERLKGTIQVNSAPGEGTTLRLSLGTSLATAHVLLVMVEEISYALPVEFVQMARLVHESEIFSIEGRETIILEGYPVSVVKLADLLELSPRQKMAARMSVQEAREEREQSIAESSWPCIILQIGEERLGLLVDALVDEQDVVLKPQSQLLQRVRNVSGATILGTGEVCMVLNPQDLLKSVRQRSAPMAQATPMLPSEDVEMEEAPSKPLVLLVEDSIATRTQEKRILEGAGYEVVTAVDGLDGYNKLKTRTFDAVVSDVQMPNMDGLALVAKIREHQEYSELPIVLVTSLARDEDKKRGAQAGANAYITKSSFNQDVLLDTLRRLV